VGEVLGLEVDISSPRIAVRVSQRRLESLLGLIAGVRAAGALLPGTAGRLVGKLQFACSGMFGKVGRAALQPLYSRQRARRGSAALSRSLLAALDFFASLLGDPPARLLPAPGAPRPPAVLYTDGNGAACIGAVLFERGEPPSVLSCRVPPGVMGLLLPRKQQNALIELIAVVVAFEVFAADLKGRDVILMVDNQTAEGTVRNGYARRVSADACALASLLWLRCAALKVNLFVQCVSSEENIADGPSRPDEPDKSRALASLAPRPVAMPVFPAAVGTALREDLGWPLAM